MTDNNTTHGDWSDAGQKPKSYTRDETVIILIERIELLTARLTIAQAALEILAEHGITAAGIALEEMRKKQ